MCVRERARERFIQYNGSVYICVPYHRLNITAADEQIKSENKWNRTVVGAHERLFSVTIIPKCWNPKASIYKRMNGTYALEFDHTVLQYGIRHADAYERVLNVLTGHHIGVPKWNFQLCIDAHTILLSQRKKNYTTEIRFIFIVIHLHA